MTHFDHFFILYSGMVVGIICFVFPLIISVFKILDDKRTEEEELIIRESETKVSQAVGNIIAAGTNQDVQIKEIKNTNINLKKIKWRKIINQFYYNPHFRLWIILIPLLVTLGLCIADIYSEQKYLLTYFSFISFIFAMFFLVDTSIRAIKQIKNSN